MRDFYDDGFKDGYGEKVYGDREYPASDGDRSGNGTDKEGRVDKEIPKHQKKSPGRKMFLIQCRFKTFSGDWGSWRTWHRYAKEESRDQALATLQTKVDFGGYGKGQVEFRRGE